MPVTVAVDLAFDLDRPGRPAVHGHLRSEGDVLVLEVSDPGAFAGSGDAATVRLAAERLAKQGLVVRVLHDGQHLVSLGAVSAPWWQRRLTGSRRIRMASARGAWTAARARARAGRAPAALPDFSLMPPLTLFPLAPTLSRYRRPLTTTHDLERGGEPRLVLVSERHQPGDRVSVFRLHTDDVTIGSDPGCDVVLSGLEAVHARLRHDEDDEWVVDAAAGVTRVHGGPVTSQRLRTGSVIQVGDHRLAFYREEYADHGRPYGGRIGGELGRDTRQPRRESRRQDQRPDL